MPPIIATLSVNSFSSSGAGISIPSQFDSMLVGGGGYGGAGGAGGSVSFTDMAGQLAQGYSFNDIQWNLRKVFTVTVGGVSFPVSGNTQIDAYDINDTLQIGAKRIAYGGGGGGQFDSDSGRNGASGGGGMAYGPAPGGTATNVYGYGPYYGTAKQGHNGGKGYRQCCYINYKGGGGGWAAAGTDAGASYNGVGGQGTNPGISANAQQFWLGVSDNSPYHGRFSRGGFHNQPNPNQPGDAGNSGIVAIRYDNIYPDPVVTGSPNFYDDTTNNKRIVVWTGTGTFQW